MSTTHTEPAAGTPRDQLAHVRGLAETVRSAEVSILLAACEWADSHPAVPDDREPYASCRRAAARR